MNSYINAQIINMIAMTKTFEQSCKMAAMRDDGKISKEETKQLKKISNATQKFLKELESLRAN